MTNGIRANGEFCWINMLTPNPTAARAFFASVLGWTYGEIPGMGHLIQVGGRPIGGLFDLAGPNTPPGTPPCIGVMVQVASADTMAEAVAQLGGKALPPFDIGPNGRMAVCFDPNGANFDLWQSKAQLGMEVDGREHGAPTWFETLTSDLERASQFYVALFGWTPEKKPMGDVKYTAFLIGAEYVAGAMERTPAMGPIPPHWAVYFAVKSADTAAQVASALGATVFVPLQDIPGIGRFCGIKSPQGVMFYVLEYRA